MALLRGVSNANQVFLYLVHVRQEAYAGMIAVAAVLIRQDVLVNMKVRYATQKDIACRALTMRNAIKQWASVASQVVAACPQFHREIVDFPVANVLPVTTVN